jgi:hypothetical protein
MELVHSSRQQICWPDYTEEPCEFTTCIGNPEIIGAAHAQSQAAIGLTQSKLSWSLEGLRNPS